MGEELRKTGIEVIGDVPWGTHFCQFYETAQDLLDRVAKLGTYGSSALSAFRGNPNAFDVVITDQIMPRMSGLELAEAIEKMRPDLPIILCTGFSEKVDGGSVGKSGIREFVMKPFTLQEISRLISKVSKKVGSDDSK